METDACLPLGTQDSKGLLSIEGICPVAIAKTSHVKCPL